MGLVPLNLRLGINKTNAIVNYELILIENLIEQLSTESDQVNFQAEDLEEFLYHEKERLIKDIAEGNFTLHETFMEGLLDVQRITGKSEQSGRRLLKKIRETLGKQEHQFITVEEFAMYTGISLDMIRDYIND